METLFCNELCWHWGFPKGWRNGGQTSHCPWSRTTKKLISFETSSTISSIKNEDSFWLYTSPSIGQDITNSVGLYYMQTMDSQTTSHLLGLGTQAHCILTFTLFPSPSPVFMKHKLYYTDGSHGASHAASSQDSWGCWAMQLLHWLCGHSLNTLLWVNKADLSQSPWPCFLNSIA